MNKNPDAFLLTGDEKCFLVLNCISMETPPFSHSFAYFSRTAGRCRNAFATAANSVARLTKTELTPLTLSTPLTKLLMLISRIKSSSPKA